MPWTSEAKRKAKGEYPGYSTAAEVARLIGAHPKTVRGWIASGREKPEVTLECGWHLFSPDHVTKILRDRARRVEM